MSEVVLAVLVAILSITSSQVSEFLIKQYQWPVSATMMTMVMMAIFFVAIYVLMSRWSRFIRMMSSVSAIEGSWVITLEGNLERPQSICKVCLVKNKWVYFGHGLSEEKLASYWSSRDIHFDEQKEELSFTADAAIIETGLRLRNYGYIKFQKNASGKYTYGNGYFVDLGESTSQVHMTLRKISDEEYDGIYEKYAQSFE